MVISWRPQREVHSDHTPDFLAFDGERVIGRMFQINHEGNAGRWFWSIIATRAGVLADPLCGVEDQQSDAARYFIEAYEQVTLSSVAA